VLNTFTNRYWTFNLSNCK